LQVSIESNIAKLTKDVPAFFRKQIPFATSQALNDTARLSATRETRQDMKSELQKVTRFTQSGMRYKRSNKRNLTSQVYMDPLRWKYMRYSVNALTKQPAGKVIAIPTKKGATYRRKYKGNWIGQIIKEGGFWLELRNGTTALFQRRALGSRGSNRGRSRRGNTGTGLVMLAYGIEKADYDMQFDYMGSVERSIEKHFNTAFNKRMRRAIDTARL